MSKKFERVLAAIAERTNVGGGGVLWQAIDSETFHTTIGSGTIRIGRGVTQFIGSDGESHPATTYTAWVMDSIGRVVEELELVEGGSDTYRIADEVFKAARRAALGGEHLLNVMLLELGQNI